MILDILNFRLQIDVTLYHLRHSFSIQTPSLYLHPYILDFTFPFFRYDTYTYSFTLKTFVVLCNRGSKKLEIIYPYFLHLIFKQKAVYTCILCMNYYIKHLYTTCRIRTAVFFRVCQLMHEEERSFFP